MPQPRGFGGRGGGQGQREALPVWPEKGQEGSRWVGERPSEEEFAAWWTGNVPIHEGLDAGDYIGGVVVIEQTEKQRRMVAAGEADTETLRIVQGERLVYTPYAKVDVRVKYFWDLMAIHPDWLGVIEPVPVPQIQRQGLTNDYMPEGFYRHAVEAGEAGWVLYIAHAARVRIYDRNNVRIVEWEDPRTMEPRFSYIGPTILQSLPATKLVPFLNYGKPDPFAMMKAETGAAGRALGMAGMLVIPGSGIATAEDVQEAIEPGTRSASASPAPNATLAPPELPQGATDAGDAGDAPVPGTPAADPGAGVTDVPQVADTPADAADADDATLRAGLLTTLVELKERDPDGYAEFKGWFEGPRAEGGRELGALSGATIETLKQPMLRGLVRRAERALQDAPEKQPEPAASPAEPPAGDGGQTAVQTAGDLTTDTPTDVPTTAPESAESSAEPAANAESPAEPADGANQQTLGG